MILQLAATVLLSTSVWTAPDSASVGFRCYSVDEGLPQSRAMEIVQDQHGFLWIATQDGLARFDGQSFLTFRPDPSDSASISRSEVLSLFIDRDGTLWIGTDRDINRLEAGPEEFVAATDDPAQTSDSYRRPSFIHISMPAGEGLFTVRAFAEDQAGRIWVAAGGGLGVVESGTSEMRWATGWPQAGADVTSVAVDHRGRVWYSDLAGLWILDPETGTSEPVEPALSGGMNRVVATGSTGGRIWLFGRGVRPRNAEGPGLSSTVDLPPEPMYLEGQDIRVVHQDPAGALWAGTGSGTLFRIRPNGEVEAFQHAPGDSLSLGAGEIFSVMTDRSGDTWIGTGRGGFCRVIEAGSPFRHVRAGQGPGAGLSEGYVTGMSARTPGVLWVGTGGGGLNRVDLTDGRVDVYRHDPADPSGIAGDYVRAVLETPDGAVWVTAGGSLQRLDLEEGSFVTIPPPTDELGPLESGHIAAITLDSEGYLWNVLQHPGTGFVAHRIDPTTHEYTEAHAIPKQMIAPNSSGQAQYLTWTRDGTLWIGMWGTGLIALRPDGTFRQFLPNPSDPSSLPGDIVQVIHEDGKGRLWVGTRGGGLGVLEPGQEGFRVVREADGLANDVVYGILEDDAGSLWFSTNRGLTRVDPDLGTFHSFTVDDGLLGNEYNRWAFTRLPDGRLAFGGLTGIDIFHPADLLLDSVPPAVALTKVRVRNQVLAAGPGAADLTEVRLAHDQNVLTLEFVALHYANPARNRYAYQMVGVDDEWVESDLVNIARYASLAPGSYEFRVRAANSDGVWSEGSHLLDIFVTPPFWVTWWFIATMSTAVGTLLFLAYRYRVAHLVREERIRTGIARDLHDEISATLTGISYFVHALRGTQGHSDADTEHKLELIANSANEARERIGDIIWAIDPEHDDWTSLFARLRRHTADLLGGHDVEYRIVMPKTVPRSVLRPMVRKHLWLMYKELLANVVRHSQCTVVDIHMGFRGGTLHLSVADDGIGFDESAGTSGNGVSNVRARAEKLGADLRLDTAPGEGTQWTLVHRP